MRLRPALLAMALAPRRPAGPVAAGLADQVGATFGLMVQDMVDAFPPVEGMVAGVQGDQIFIALAAKDGIQAGQEFTVFRKGEVFRHPLSRQPLGRYEDVLGHAQVRRVYPDFAEAVYVATDPRHARARRRTGCASRAAASGSR